MARQRNPFVELYVTENISADRFVNIFSPVLVEESETHALFQPGNVMLTGLQGAGKTALLNLLKPEVQIAYARSSRQWPLPPHCSRYIAAGINLQKSSAMDFGQRPLVGQRYGAEEDVVVSLLFGDFLNYWIVDDLLSGLETIWASKESSLITNIALNLAPSRLDDFARSLAEKSCWFGAMEGVQTYQALRNRIDDRIAAYRSFLNFNSDLSDDISRTKSSAGEPIGVCAETLKQFEILGADVPVFVRIDQFEDLIGLETRQHMSPLASFRSVVMKMLGTRDNRVSYRVGARPYSFYPDFKMFGTNAAAEELRNFKIVDIGDLLRGKEARRSLFSKFCSDVFRRRLDEAELLQGTSRINVLKRVFSSKMPSRWKARHYIKGDDNLTFRGISEPTGAASVLADLARVDPLSAKLGEAWLLQQASRRAVELGELADRPWEAKSRQWWWKERVQQALLQISASKRQRMIWAGADDVISLSGRNILVFLTLCQFIWSELLRTDEADIEGLSDGINPVVQDMGIQEASAYWFRKIKADPHGGDDRHRFVSVLGSSLRSALRDDRKMSYPGANGFSLSEAELEKTPDVARFLDLCVAYGVLESYKHTPKADSRGQSRKWYLTPILTPYFQLPTPHTKEPFYAKPKDVRRWMDAANGLRTTSEFARQEQLRSKSQMSFLFGDDE